METEIITSRQRDVQKQKIDAAISILRLAATETKTATPREMAQTIDVALEIINGINNFLKLR